jgi:hypothetical protein
MSSLPSDIIESQPLIPHSGRGAQSEYQPIPQQEEQQPTQMYNQLPGAQLEQAEDLNRKLLQGADLPLPYQPQIQELPRLDDYHKGNIAESRYEDTQETIEDHASDTALERTGEREENLLLKKKASLLTDQQRSKRIYNLATRTKREGNIWNIKRKSERRSTPRDPAYLPETKSYTPGRIEPMRVDNQFQGSFESFSSLSQIHPQRASQESSYAAEWHPTQASFERSPQAYQTTYNYDYSPQRQQYQQQPSYYTQQPLQQQRNWSDFPMTTSIPSHHLQPLSPYSPVQQKVYEVHYQEPNRYSLGQFSSAPTQFASTGYNIGQSPTTYSPQIQTQRPPIGYVTTQFPATSSQQDPLTFKVPQSPTNWSNFEPLGVDNRPIFIPRGQPDVQLPSKPLSFGLSKIVNPPIPMNMSFGSKLIPCMPIKDGHSTEERLFDTGERIHAGEIPTFETHDPSQLARTAFGLLDSLPISVSVRPSEVSHFQDNLVSPEFLPHAVHENSAEPNRLEREAPIKVTNDLVDLVFKPSANITPQEPTEMGISLDLYRIPVNVSSNPQPIIQSAPRSEEKSPIFIDDRAGYMRLDNTGSNFQQEAKAAEQHLNLLEKQEPLLSGNQTEIQEEVRPPQSKQIEEFYRQNLEGYAVDTPNMSKEYSSQQQRSHIQDKGHYVAPNTESLQDVHPPREFYDQSKQGYVVPNPILSEARPPQSQQIEEFYSQNKEGFVALHNEEEERQQLGSAIKDEHKSHIFQTPIRKHGDINFENDSTIKQKLDFTDVGTQGSRAVDLTPTRLFDNNQPAEDLKWKEIAPNAPAHPLPPQEVQWDLVMKLPNIDKLHKGIKIKRGEVERFNNYQKAQYIAVLGFPGTGKSAVANYLINKTMNTGYQVEDNQFKFKIVETEVDQTIANVIFDTPGLNYPLKSEKDISKLFSSHYFNQMALLKEANTAFLIDFVRTMAHTVVLTMERTTFFDQVLLALFAQMKGDREIIVIHNFPDVTTPEELDSRINQEIINAFHAKKELLQPFDIPVYIQDTPQYEHKQQIIHLVMVNNHSELANLNEHVFNYINSQLTTTNRFRDMTMHGPVGELVNVLRDQVKNYVTFDSTDINPDFKFNSDKKRIEFVLEEEELDLEERLQINPKFPKFFSFAQSGYNMPIQTLQEVAHQNFVPQCHILREDDNGIRFLFEISLLKYDSVDFKLFPIEEQGGAKYMVQLQADRYLQKIHLEFPNAEFVKKGDFQEKVSWTGEVDVGTALDNDAEKFVTIYEHGVLYVFVPFQ